MSVRFQVACVIVLILSACDNKSNQLQLPNALAPGVYVTRDGSARLDVATDGTLRLFVGSQQAIRAKFRWEGAVAHVTAIDKKEVDFVIGGSSSASGFSVLLPIAQLKEEQKLDVWERERAQQMKQSEGARLKAVAEMKRAAESRRNPPQ